MGTCTIIVHFIIFAVQILCQRSTRRLLPGLTVTDDFRNKIALEVLKVSPVNTVVSSLALRMPLCKLMTVATGDAKRELMSALGFHFEKDVHTCYKDIRRQLTVAQLTELMMHNKMYFNDSLDVDDNFRKNSFTDFGVKIDRVGFRMPKTAAKYMNRWVASDTLNRISTLIEDDDIDNLSSIVLLSGLHYKGSWESPFDIRFTQPKLFRDEANRVVKIPMMIKLGNFDYVDDVNYNVKVLNLKFNTMDSSITFIMPAKKNGLPELLQKLSNDHDMMTKLKQNLKNKFIKIYLPRIKIKTYVDWTDFLKVVGINKILDRDKANLDGVLKNGTKSDIPVHLTRAKQKVFLELDELGLYRQIKHDDDRETQEMIQFGDMAEEFALDQPFYFAISFHINGFYHDLFNGVYRKPEQGEH